MNGLWHHHTLLFGRETLPRSLEKEVTPEPGPLCGGERGAAGGQRSMAQDGELSATPQEQRVVYTVLMCQMTGESL